MQSELEQLPEQEAEALRAEKRKRAIELLRSWAEDGGEEDEKEQKETFECIKKALGEDRLGYRKLF